jgi:hypothetical protein
MVNEVKDVAMVNLQRVSAVENTVSTKISGKNKYYIILYYKMASNLIQTQMSKKEDKPRRGPSPQPTIQSTSVLSSIRDDNPKPIIPDEKTIETIKRIFSPKIIEINNKININIIDSECDGICALFVIYPDHIHIKALAKCGTTTGNNLLEKFDRLVSEIPNMTYVMLDDESNIELCGHKIKLYTLKILTTGQSWYNSKGYVSDNNDDQKTVNARIINTQYEEFRDKLSAQEATVIDTGNRLFPETPKKTTVQDYFKYVLNDINRNIKEKGCDDEETKAKCRWLSEIIDIINKMPYSISYNQFGLVKEQLAGGAKIKRSKTKRSNKSKKNKSKKNKSKKSKSKKSKSKKNKK